MESSLCYSKYAYKVPQKHRGEKTVVSERSWKDLMKDKEKVE